MPRGLHVDGPMRLSVREYRDQPLAPHDVRVRVELAAMKHGTLYHLLGGDSPFARHRFDPVSRLFVRDEGQDPTGPHFDGNQVAGVVAEVGAAVTRHRVGDRVFAYGPACETVTLAEVDCWPLDGLDPRDAVCLDPAFFALGAVRDARVGVGDRVAVFGLGAIGLMTVQWLARAGCEAILAVDPVAGRRELALSLGATRAVAPGDRPASVARTLGCAAGLDVAIEASGHYQALAEAIRCVRPGGRIGCVGYYGGGAEPLRLGAEFFHNRVELIASLPAWSNPPRDALWDEARLREACVAALRGRRVRGEPLLTPTVRLDAAPAEFIAMASQPERGVKLAIAF